MNTPIDLEALKGFTPGPWEEGRPDMRSFIEGQQGKYIYAGELYVAATGFDVGEWDEIMANSRLIAAAPQLYAELVEARKQLQEIQGR